MKAETTCPECGGQLIKKSKRMCCEHCDFYFVVENSKERIIRSGYLDRVILPAKFNQEIQERTEIKRNWFNSNKFNKKGELK